MAPENERDPSDTYRATLVRAAVILGGAHALCRHLQVPMPVLTRWLAGDGAPPPGLFLKAVDVLIADSEKATFERVTNLPPPESAPDA